jgi:hypothetical protein
MQTDRYDGWNVVLISPDGKTERPLALSPHVTPRTRSKARFKFCAEAYDPSGNENRRSCARLDTTS